MPMRVARSFSYIRLESVGILIDKFATGGVKLFFALKKNSQDPAPTCHRQARSDHKNAEWSLKRCKWFTKSISQRPAVIAQIQPARKLADPSCPAELDYHGHGLTGPTRYPSFIAAQALQPLRLLARDRANHLLMPAAAASSVVAEENSFALQGKILVLAPLRHRLILVS